MQLQNHHHYTNTHYISILFLSNETIKGYVLLSYDFFPVVADFNELIMAYKCWESVFMLRGAAPIPYSHKK